MEGLGVVSTLDRALRKPLSEGALELTETWMKRSQLPGDPRGQQPEWSGEQTRAEWSRVGGGEGLSSGHWAELGFQSSFV